MRTAASGQLGVAAMERVLRVRAHISSGRVDRKLADFDQSLLGDEHHLGALEFVDQPSVAIEGSGLSCRRPLESLLDRFSNEPSGSQSQPAVAAHLQLGLSADERNDGPVDYRLSDRASNLEVSPLPSRNAAGERNFKPLLCM